MNTDKEKVFKKCVRSLLSNGMPLTNTNIMIQSIMVAGGTLDESEACKYMHKYINIGFCQRSFYKPAVWRLAVDIMEYLKQENLVQDCDFGRGKGKYTSEDSTVAIVNFLNVK